MAVVWIADMTDRAFENAGKFKYPRKTAVNETAFRRKLRAGQVRSGQVRSRGCLLPVDWCCVVIAS
jgi:hypothetical protein